MKPERLVVVTGGGRMGTSLVCDLAEACGYSLGPKVKRSDDLRAIRNECGDMHRKLPGPQVEREALLQAKLLEFAELGTTVVKVAYHWDFWLPELLREIDDLRVLVCLRDPDRVRWSRRSLDVKSDWEVNVPHENSLSVKYLTDPDYETLAVSFEQLLRKDEGQLRAIIDFLGSEATIESLAAIIHPEVVRYPK